MLCECRRKSLEFQLAEARAEIETLKVYKALAGSLNAKIDRLGKVLATADRLISCIAEFPKQPNAWGEYMEALEVALAQAKE
jgi:hypothetical protein